MPRASLAIGPAGAECGADAEGTFDSLLVAVDPGELALAAAEEAYDVRLMDRLLVQDETLARLAAMLAEESARQYSNGALYWNALTSRFIEGLLLRHTAEPPRPTRGRLGKDTLKRLRDYVDQHLDETIAVAELSRLAGRSPFHFSRIFVRTVGVTPHRYVVRLRLKRAVELAREGRLSLAEIAARTGFADQSHLSRWVRRVYGASLAQFVPA